MLAEETHEGYYSQEDNAHHDNDDDTNYHEEESVNDIHFPPCKNSWIHDRQLKKLRTGSH